MDTTHFKERTHKAALKYVARGCKVLPLYSINEDGSCTCGKKACPNAGKHPRTRNGLKDASTSIEKINEWFGEGAPLSNIGIVTGKVSGITVIDIDSANGKRGFETWARLIDGHGEPRTLIAKTGSGGVHIYFKYNSALKTGTNRLGEAVDVRNDSAYVVAPPSRHRSGGTYEWL